MIRKWKLYQNNLWKPLNITDIEKIKFIENYFLNLNQKVHKTNFHIAFFKCNICLFEYNIFNNIMYINKYIINELINVNIKTDYIKFIKFILKNYYNLNIKNVEILDDYFKYVYKIDYK